jgi:putative DeoR family transcriptional regulator (stage III sporulation protein D)
MLRPALQGGSEVKDYIWNRVLEISRHIHRTRDTVRETAEVFGVSKSTVHKDVTERLPRINPELANEVKLVLDFNKAERHIRGGAATKQKYLEN